MSGLIWNTPYWDDDVIKHRSVAGKPWATVRRSTKKGRRIAKYHPDMTLDDIRDLEMSFDHPNDLIVERKTVRYYFAKSDKPIVGASLGVDTQFIVINWCQNGSVHGYPQNLDELIDYIRKNNRPLFERFKRRYNV